MKIAIPALIIGVIALAVKQTPLLREVSGSIYWNITELLIKFPVAVSILFGMLLFRDKLANSAILSLLGTISLELYLVHMYFLKVIESPIDIVPFFALSLALAYSFFKFNSLYKSIQLPFKKPSPQTP